MTEVNIIILTQFKGTELNSQNNGCFKGITIISDHITKSHSGCTDFAYMHLHNNIINVIHLQIS